MNEHVFYRPLVVGILLACCLAGVGPVALGQAPNEGTPRPMYATGFTPGTRVELLEDAPSLDPELKARMSGIIVCCDATDCSGSILVSWNLWRGGRDTDAACATSPVGLYPAGSVTWVNPSAVRLGLPIDAVGRVKKGPDDCMFLTLDDGPTYRLAVTREFMKKWWVVTNGSRWRVNGLLDTRAPDPNVEQTCGPVDGTVYHPIMSPPSWEGSCPWCTQPFQSGDRVVLTSQSDPYGAVDLPRGATGTVICGDYRLDRSLLVSWDLWTGGVSDDDYLKCTERFAGVFPLGSMWWVARQDVGMYFETTCGTLQETALCGGADSNDTTGLGFVQPNSDTYCLPDIAAADSLLGGQVKVFGLLSPIDAPLLSQLKGTISDSLVIPCPQTGSCQPALKPGDRVRLLVNQPAGVPDLFVGEGGKIICINPDDPITSILVSWDNWTGGSNDLGPCQGPFVPIFTENSLLWMACTEIRKVVLPDLYAKDTPRAFSPSTIEPGMVLEIDGVIGNRGATQSGTFFVKFYLSADTEITQDDYYLGGMGIDLGPGGLTGGNVLFQTKLSATVAPGTYYVVWLIDPDNAVNEYDENNNVIVLDSQLTVAGE